MKELKRKRAQTCLPGNKKSCTNNSRKSNNVIAGSSDKSSDDPKVPFDGSSDSVSWEVKKSICRYLIENGHEFSISTSPSFKKMINLCLLKVDCHIPTVKELKGLIFKDVVKEIDIYVKTIKNSWADTGCSVLLDECTDPKGRNIMNVLVDCPKGSIYIRSYDISDVSRDTNAFQHLIEVVLGEIGIGNVLQVITNSTLLLKIEYRIQFK